MRLWSQIQHSPVGDSVALRSSWMVYRVAIRHRSDQADETRQGGRCLAGRYSVPAKEHWKYEGSRAAEGHGGRTHTFGIKNPAIVIRDAVIYQAPKVRLYRGKPSLVDPAAEDRG